VRGICKANVGIDQPCSVIDTVNPSAPNCIDGECDLATLRCRPIKESSSKTKWRHPGETCENGEACETSICRPDKNDVKRCFAYLEDGAACNTGVDRPCLPPAFCVDHSCKIVDHADCR
jgi:hypothetical protein